MANMGTNQQAATPGEPSISEGKNRKRRMENNEARINDLGSRRRTHLGDGQTFAPVDQDGPRQHQYISSSNDEYAASSQKPGIPERRDRIGQYEEARQIADRIRTLEQQISGLRRCLCLEKKEKDYYKRKTTEYYKKLCAHEPAMLAEYHQRTQAVFLAANANAAPRPPAPISSATVPSILRSPAPPSSAAVTFVPPLSAPISSAKIAAVPRQSDPCPSTVPPVPRSSTPLPLAPAPSAPRQAAVLSPAPSRPPPSSVSPVAAYALHIDLTLDETPPSSPTSQKRKRAPEQEGQAGDHLRKKILTKPFEWMEPKDRPNYKQRNPYKPDATSSERPLDLDPTETDGPYPTDSLQYDHYLGQASPEPPLSPSQAPAHQPASAKLPKPQKIGPGRPGTCKPNNKNPQATVKAQRLDKARERMKTKKEQNTPTAGKTRGQEAEDYGAKRAETEAILEGETKYIAMVAAELEDLFGRDESD